MVSCRIVSQYSGTLPSPNGDRKIKGLSGPLYDPAVVLDILGDVGVTPWSNGCLKDMQKWEFDQDDVTELTQHAIKFGQYRDSEWCQSKADGPWAACDSYRCIRKEWNDNAYKDLNCEYYIKVAIGKTGKVLLLVSCHPSGS